LVCAVSSDISCFGNVSGLADGTHGCEALWVRLLLMATVRVSISVTADMTASDWEVSTSFSLLANFCCCCCRRFCLSSKASLAAAGVRSGLMKIVLETVSLSTERSRRDVRSRADADCSSRRRTSNRCGLSGECWPILRLFTTCGLHSR